MRLFKILAFKLGLLLTVLPYQSNGQVCKTPMPESISTPSRKSGTNLRSASQLQDSYCLKIYVHVIRKDDGSGGQSREDVEEALAYLDTAFNQLGIYFRWDNSIDFIDSTDLYKLPNAPRTRYAKAVFNVHNHNDGIDIYMYSDSVDDGGFANGVGESSELFVSGADSIGSYVKSHVISHEMGHVLALWHTHYTGSCREYVDGSNADTCGDLVEDTPADPRLSGKTDTNCNYIENETDPQGDIYNPDEHNMMSYAPVNCRDYFSEGQGIRMKHAVEDSLHLQKARVSCDCRQVVNVSEDVNSGESDIRQATESITAYNTVKSGGFAKYTGDKVAKLSSGFDAKKGADFDIKVESCIAGSSSSSRVASAGDSKKDGSRDHLALYPNPADNLLHVRYDYKDNNYQVRIYNQLGRVVKRKQVSATNNQLALGGLPSGVYYLSLVLEGKKMESEKFVIR